MPISVEAKRALFRSLHQSGCFTMARPRNVGGLRRIEGLGASAIETTVMGFTGWSDRTAYQVAGKTSFPHLARVCEDTDLPVSVELEAAGGDIRPWAECVRAAIKAGVAGLSICERADVNEHASDSLIDHIRLAREVIAATEQDIMLQVHCERLMTDPARRDSVSQHLRAYAEAGADVFCIPGSGKPSLIKAVVDTVSPRAVSVVVQDAAVNVNAVCALGVRRVTMGFALGADSWPGFERGYATVLSRAVESSRQLLR